MSRWLLQPVMMTRGDARDTIVSDPLRQFCSIEVPPGLEVVHLSRGEGLVEFLLRNHRTMGRAPSSWWVQGAVGGGGVWLGVVGEAGEILGCVSLDVVEVRGWGRASVRVGYVDHLTVKEGVRGRGLVWVLVKAAVECGVREGVVRQVFGRDSQLGELPFPQCVRVPVQQGGCGVRDLTYTEGGERALLGLVERLRMAVESGCDWWVDPGRKEVVRRWRVLVVEGAWLCLASQSAHSMDKNVQGLWVHGAFGVGDLKSAAIGWNDECDTLKQTLWVPEHYGTGAMVDGLRAGLRRASDFLVQEQNWSSGRAWECREVFMPWT